MTLQVIGAICILIALIGGGLKIREVEIPRLSRLRITALMVVGAAFIGLGLMTDVKSVAVEPGAPPPAAQASDEKGHGH